MPSERNRDTPGWWNWLVTLILLLLTALAVWVAAN